MSQKLFEKYSKRIAKEGILKAFLISLSIAACVLALTAFFSWFFGFKAGLYLAIGLFVLALGACTPLIYIWKFRPTTKEIAKRIDELGLEERVLTMTELEGDESYIAKAQREDTKRALGHVDHMLIKIAVSATLIAIAAVGGFIGLSMMTVDSLYVAGVIPSGLTSIREIGGTQIFTVSYGVELSDDAIAKFKAESTPIPESGFGTVYYYDEEHWKTTEAFADSIEVKEGEAAPAVLAMPARDYVFVEWSDGSRDPFRTDVVKGDLSLFAIFEPIDDMNVEDPVLQDPSSQNQQNSGDSQDGQNGSQDSNGNGQDGDGDPSAGGSHNNASNSVLDGETFYGDVS